MEALYYLLTNSVAFWMIIGFAFLVVIGIRNAWRERQYHKEIMRRVHWQQMLDGKYPGPPYC